MVLQFTIDHNKIDADLTHFPFTLILNSDNAKNVFETIGDNYKKLKVSTDFNGANELFVEVEYWNANEQRAVLHVSRSDWVISSSFDTFVYLHYGATLPDNYHVGDTGSIVAQNVWDSNYVMVLHMGSSLTDSTSNGNDGTATGTSVVDSLYAKGRKFDGTNDYIDVGNDTSITTGLESGMTLQALVKYDTLSSTQRIIDNDYSENSFYLAFVTSDSRNYFCVYDGGSWYSVSGDSSMSTSNYVLINGIDTGSSNYIIENTTKTSSVSHGSLVFYQNNIHLGVKGEDLPSITQPFDGIMKEVRISNTARSDAWIKADYYSLFNQLVKDVIPLTKPKLYILGSAGEETASGGSEATVNVGVEGSGKKTAQGSSESIVALSVEGAGSNAAFSESTKSKTAQASVFEKISTTKTGAVSAKLSQTLQKSTFTSAQKQSQKTKTGSTTLEETATTSKTASTQTTGKTQKSLSAGASLAKPAEIVKTSATCLKTIGQKTKQSSITTLSTNTKTKTTNITISKENVVNKLINISIQETKTGEYTAGTSVHKNAVAPKTANASVVKETSIQKTANTSTVRSSQKLKTASASLAKTNSKTKQANVAVTKGIQKAAAVSTQKKSSKEINAGAYTTTEILLENRRIMITNHLNNTEYEAGAWCHFNITLEQYSPDKGDYIAVSDFDITDAYIEVWNELENAKLKDCIAENHEIGFNAPEIPGKYYLVVKTKDAKLQKLNRMRLNVKLGAKE